MHVQHIYAPHEGPLLETLDEDDYPASLSVSAARELGAAL